MKRVPIIFHRKPIIRPLITIEDFLGCNSCVVNNCSKPDVINETNCCNGLPIVAIGSPKQLHNGMELIDEYLKRSQEVPFFMINFDEHEDPSFPSAIIENLTMRNLPSILIASKKVPRDLLVKMSANPFNIVQMNLSNLGLCHMSDYSKEDKEVINDIQETLYNSKTNGLQTIVRVEPIVPSVVQASTVIELMNSMRYSCNHLILKFADYLESHIKTPTTDKYYNIEGLLVSKDKFTVRSGRVYCSEDYVNTYLEKLDMFKQDLTISVCGVPEYNTPSCFGIPLRTSVKIHDSLFTFRLED